MDIEKDKQRIKKILEELRGNGYDYRDGDVKENMRQELHHNKAEKPITIIFNKKEKADKVKEAADRAGLWFKRIAKEDDVEHDRKGWFIPSRTRLERRKRAAYLEWKETRAGRIFTEYKAAEEATRSVW